MIRLYLTPLPEQTTDTASDQIGSDIQQAGLLEGGGTAVENIATESVDFRKEGRVQLGPTLSRKVAEELDSLSESSYTTLPLFDASGSSLGRKRAYYEVTRADVEPAQSARDDVYSYDVQLTNAGTREDSLRRVTTNVEDVTTEQATGTPAPIGIPAAATEPRWYDDAQGATDATPTNTASAEYGNVDFFDPADAPATNPELVYDLPFEDDGPVDVRVYDDRDRAKLTQTASGGEANVWTHAYHTGYQFDGTPVIDTGRLRVYLDSDAGTVTAETWDAESSSWSSVGITMGDYDLARRSFTRIGPESVAVTVTLRDTTTGDTTTALMRARRGRDVVLFRPRSDTNLPAGFTNVFDPIISDQTTDPNPRQGLRARGDVE